MKLRFFSFLILLFASLFLQVNAKDNAAFGSRLSENELYIHVEASRTSLYEQEPVLLTYTVFVKNNLNLSDVQLENKPDFLGMVSYQLPLNSIVTTHSGTYRKGVILQYLVYPLQSGKLTIPRLSFQCNIVEPHNLSQTIIGQSAMGTPIRRYSRSVSLNVFALPHPKPVNYSGGVGNFNVKAAWTSDELKTNEFSNYRITLSGSGNLKMIKCPEIVFPKGFEIYSSKTIDRTRLTPHAVEGEIIYEYVVVPKDTGTFEQSAFMFSFYNTKTHSYQTVKLPSQELRVKKGKTVSQSSDVKKESSSGDIHNIILDYNSSNDVSKPFWWGTFSHLLAHVFVLMIACFSFYFFYHRQRRKSVSNDAYLTLRTIYQRLNTLDIQYEAGKSKTFYDELSEIVSDYLGVKYNFSPHELSQEKLSVLAHENKWRKETLLLLSECLQEIEHARFTPPQDQPLNNDLLKKIKYALDGLEL